MQPLPALKATSSLPQTFGEVSELSPETLAESSEEATQNLEAILDPCLDITQTRNFNQTRAFEVNTKRLFKVSDACCLRELGVQYKKMILILWKIFCVRD